ncbi:unnamed protein product [Aspergillus oryzae]|nr:unnamed protein product [Aspergillus oryzae]GMF92117.1 unnamed protein product [Aspergillus oryzae]GMG00563.1 unnamed protein product [Aspergillus oryzae]
MRPLKSNQEIWEPLPYFFFFLHRGLFPPSARSIQNPHGDASTKTEEAIDRWSQTAPLAVGGPDLPRTLPSPTSAKDQEQYQFE